MGNLDGKVALVTGAASGIGQATAQRFEAEGATVIGTDITTGHDVTDEDRTQQVVQEILDEHGRLDIAVTAAGVAGGGPVHLLERDEWQRVQDVNLTGTFLTCKHAARPMVEQRSGSIITIASVEGLGGAEGGSTYNASKGGVVLLTKNMAMDYGRLGIRVNSICPGFIDTPLLQSVFEVMGEELQESIRQQHQLGRLGRADEIAAAASFLASDDASFITGVALPVDGGYMAGARHGFADMMGLA